MNIIHEASKLNRLGISLLLNNQDLIAVEAFKSSIRHLRMYQQKILDNNIVIDSKPIELLPIHIECSDKEMLHMNDSSYYLFCKPIGFGIKAYDFEHEHDQATSPDISVFSAIVLFNAALAHHRVGKIRQKSKVSKEAIQLYSRVCELVDVIAVDSDFAQQLMIAAVNNQAQIHQQLFQFMEMVESTDFVRTLQTCMRPNDDRSVNHFLSEVDIKEFHLNQMVTSFPSSAPIA